MKMAARVVPEKINVILKLNNGSSSSGAVRTIPLSMGKMNEDAFDADKALAISRLIAACLTKSVYETVKVETSQITN